MYKKRLKDFNLQPSAFSLYFMAVQLDEQLRRYQDLARRATDLRSYL
jgi:hypothetical protein